MLTDEQYQALETVYEELRIECGDEVSRDLLIAEIDRRVAAGLMPPIFTATAEEAYQRYKQEVICVFMKMWESKHAKAVIGAVKRADQEIARLARKALAGEKEKPDVIYAPPDHAKKNPAVAAATVNFARHGITEVERYTQHAVRYGDLDREEAIGRLNTVIDNLNETKKAEGIRPLPSLIEEPSKELTHRLRRVASEFRPHLGKPGMAKFLPFFQFVDSLGNAGIAVND